MIRAKLPTLISQVLRQDWLFLGQSRNWFFTVKGSLHPLPVNASLLRLACLHGVEVLRRNQSAVGVYGGGGKACTLPYHSLWVGCDVLPWQELTPLSWALSPQPLCIFAALFLPVVVRPNAMISVHSIQLVATLGLFRLGTDRGWPAPFKHSQKQSPSPTASLWGCGVQFGS